LLKGHTQRVNALSFSSFYSENSILASGGDDSTMKIWKISLNSENNECAWTYDKLQPNARIFSVTFHPSAVDILSAITSKSVVVLSLDAQEMIFDMPHPDLVTGLTWNGDGR
jgi:WD40 repeat protein